MSRRHFSILGIGLTFTLMACGQQNATVQPTPREVNASEPQVVPITTDNAVIAEQLQQNLKTVQSSLSPEDARNAQFIDFKTGLAYDAQRGLIKVDIGHIDASTGKIKFMSGASLPLPSGQNPFTAQNLNAQALESTKCAPYYQVQSKTGYYGIQGTITPSTSTDFGLTLDAGEAIYNYFAGYFANATAPFEGGIFTSGGTNYVQRYWYGYVRGGGVSNGYMVLRDFNPSSFTDGRFEGGQPVSMELKIPSSGMVAFIISRSGVRKVYSFSQSSSSSTTGTIWGRTTSLLINSGTTTTGNNAWSGVGIGMNAGYPTYNTWTSTYTATGFPKAVTVNSQAPNCPRAASIGTSNVIRDYQDTVTITQNPD